MDYIPYRYAGKYVLFKLPGFKYIHRMSEIVIRAENVYKSFPNVQAVQNLSFQVEGATCFSFLGPNGAGKTTMMKMLYAKAIPDKREDTVIDVYGYNPMKEQLQIKYLSGMVHQDNSLDEDLNVVQNLRIFANFFGISRKRSNEKIEELLAFMELEEKQKAKIKHLSGGMKRRLAIARSLLNDPKLLILDEPTTGLDPQVRQLIWDKLRSLKRTGVTILLTTHYMDEAFQLADSLIIMDKGIKILEGDPRRLLETEIEPYVLEILDKEVAAKISGRLDGNGKFDVRRDESDERVLFFGKEFKVLQNLVSEEDPRHYYLRQINLEDLFLQATGRRLNEQQ